MDCWEGLLLAVPSKLVQEGVLHLLGIGICVSVKSGVLQCLCN
jgi:hypothetical protein